jgi:hypothetical protein
MNRRFRVTTSGTFTRTGYVVLDVDGSPEENRKKIEEGFMGLVESDIESYFETDDCDIEEVEDK